MELKDKNGLTEKEFLKGYHPGDYERPSVTVDLLVFAAPGLNAPLSIPQFTEHSIQLLLIKRGGHPCLGCWALPGGFVNPDETLTHAAYRELVEETGVKDLDLSQLYTFSQPGRDPRTWVMSCAHIALINTDTATPTAGDDADSAAWFNVHLKIMQKKETLCQYQLILENDFTRLDALLECPNTGFNESTCKVIENNGLAFDHPKMILCGLLRLLNR